jgi:large subunit ribosomal protein L12
MRYTMFERLNKEFLKHNYKVRLMEYLYAAMLLHKAGKPIDEDNITKVLKAAGIEIDPARVKVVVGALSEIDIEEAIKIAPSIMPAAVTTTESTKSETPKVEEKVEEEEEKEEEALEGLGALFG